MSDGLKGILNSLKGNFSSHENESQYLINRLVKI